MSVLAHQKTLDEPVFQHGAVAFERDVVRPVHTRVCMCCKNQEILSFFGETARSLDVYTHMCVWVDDTARTCVL